MIRIFKKVDKKLRHYLRIPKTLVKYALRKDRSSPRYIFHHIPKCGGTSAVDALTNWFIVLKDYPLGWSDEDNYCIYRKFCARPIDLNQVKPYQLLVGHYHLENSFLHQRYPNWKKKGYRLFTFLRDPLELQISLYYYEIRNKRISAEEPIEERLLLRQNFIASLMHCNNSNYLEVLHQYHFIGIVEKYQESFDRLARLMNKPAVKLKIYNESPRQDYQLSESFIARFKARNQLDYKIYDYSKSFY